MSTKLKLNTGITIRPQRNPLLLANEIAALNYHSDGSLLLSVGAGWLREEIELFGGNAAAYGNNSSSWSKNASEVSGI